MFVFSIARNAAGKGVREGEEGWMKGQISYLLIQTIFLRLLKQTTDKGDISCAGCLACVNVCRAPIVVLFVVFIVVVFVFVTTTSMPMTITSGVGLFSVVPQAVDGGREERSFRLNDVVDLGGNDGERVR